jgi:hypothetical protein
MMLLEEFDNRDAVTGVYGTDYRPEEQFDHYLYGILSGHPTPGLLYWSDLCLAGWTMTDMFDDLAAFPVPPRMVPFAAKDNLQALLSAAAATPKQLLRTDDGALQQECAELAVFAAAWLNLGGKCSPGLRGNRDNCIEFADHLTQQAQWWLGSNTPKFVYAMKVEDLIVQASAIPA